MCFQRNLDANFLCKIYEKGLLPSASELFGRGNLTWILQEGNDPKHRSKGELTKEWNRLPTDLAAELVESMIRRVTKLIESNGDYTMY